MNKKILIVLAVLVVLIIGGIILMNKIKTSVNKQNPQTKNSNTPAVQLSPLNAKYLVESKMVNLENGKEESISPYGAQKQTTEIWGAPVSGDLNSDGQNDYAVIITQKTENDPGVYYYAAIALVDQQKNLIVGSNAVPMGDRIDIKNVAIVNDAVRINYLDWKTNGDEVEASPTMPVIKSYILDGVMFRELTEKRANAQAEAACTDNGGEWTKDSNQCKNLSQEWCQKNGGEFKDNVCNF